MYCADLGLTDTFWPNLAEEFAFLPNSNCSARSHIVVELGKFSLFYFADHFKFEVHYRRLDLERERDRRRRLWRRSAEDRLELVLRLRRPRYWRWRGVCFLVSSAADSLSDELLSPESRFAFTFLIISFSSSSRVMRASSALIFRLISAFLSALSTWQTTIVGKSYLLFMLSILNHSVVPNGSSKLSLGTGALSWFTHVQFSDNSDVLFGIQKILQRPSN